MFIGQQISSARFFTVTIDKLICSDEMISVAENEKREFADKYVSLICNVMDILPVILLFIPAFGDGTGSSEAVSVFGLSGIIRLSLPYFGSYIKEYHM